MAREEYDKPSQRLMVALESKAARLLGEADILDLCAARLRTEARRSGELGRAYGTLPPQRLRPPAPTPFRARKETAPGSTPDAA